MDVSLVQKKLAQLQNKNNEKKERVDYTKIYWKPEVGKTQIRIVPSAYDPQNPFVELKFHYGITNKVMLSPTCYGEKDPIILFSNKLRENYSKENYFLAKKLEPKTRIFVPVIVRGEEDKGVRLWQFGKQIYEELLSLAADEEIGDYTDVLSGRDFTVETIGKEATGTGYDKSNIRPRMKSSPLSDDNELVKKWLSEQPNPIEQFRKYSFDEMKEALEKWLTPEEETEEETEEEVIEEEIPVKTKFSVDTSKAKKTKEDKFDSLFEEKTTEPLPLEDEENLPIINK